MENSKQKKSKLPKQKVFELIRNNLATIGITPKLADQSYPFNESILFRFLMIGTGTCCTFIYIFNDANTFADYVQSIYIGSLGLLIIIALLIIFPKVKKLFEFINTCISIVNAGELVYLGINF